MADDSSPQQKQTPRKPSLPLDHGWAWVIMLAVFTNLICVITFLRAWALLFLRFLDIYNASATMMTLALGLVPGMFALSAFLQPIIVLPRFTVRTITMTAGVVNALAILYIAFAPDILTLIIANAVMGFAHGCIPVAQAMILGQYFRKRLSLAMVVSTMGFSLAAIVGPQFTQALIDFYGVQGAVIILAGLNLHIVPSSMLFRPVSSYASAPVIAEISIEQEDSRENDKENERSTYTEEVNKQALENDITENNKYMLNEEKELILNDTNDDISKVELTQSKNEISANVVLYKNEQQPFLPLCDNQTRDKEKLRPDDQNQKSIYSPNTTDLEVERISHYKSNCLQRLKAWASQSMFIQPIALLLIISSGLGIHTQATITYVPALALENGVEEHHAPMLLTLVGVCDLVSKLGIGLLSDLRLVRPVIIASVSQIALGTLQQFVAFYQGLELMVPAQVVTGLTFSVYVILLPVITVHLLSKEHIAHIMGAFYLVNGLVAALDHIMTGAFKDATDSFHVPYHIFGAFSVLGGLTLLVLDAWVRKKKKYVKEES